MHTEGERRVVAGQDSNMRGGWGRWTMKAAATQEGQSGMGRAQRGQDDANRSWNSSNAFFDLFLMR